MYLSIYLSQISLSLYLSLSLYIYRERERESERVEVKPSGAALRHTHCHEPRGGRSCTTSYPPRLAETRLARKTLSYTSIVEITLS